MSDDEDEIDYIIAEEEVDNFKNDNSLIIRSGNDRESGNRCSKFEYTNLIGYRISQINMGAPFCIDESVIPISVPNRIDLLVREELRQKKTPLIVVRDWPGVGNIKELWSVKELEMPSYGD